MAVLKKVESPEVEKNWNQIYLDKKLAIREL